MKRMMAFALVITLGNTSLALAEESLLKAGSRQVQRLTRVEAPTAPASGARKSSASVGAPLAAAFQGGQTLQTSGLKKSAKWLIAIGAAAAFVGAAYAIDSRVEDSTPSSLGTRRDGL